MTEFHYYTPSGPALIENDMSSTTTRLAAPLPTETNAIHREDLDTLFSVTNTWYAPGIKVYQKYHKVNTSSNLAYTVKDAAGKWVGGATVTLSVGKGYSGSTANVTNGTTATNTAAAANTDQAQWVGTTDPFGTVMWNLTSTDTVGSANPATLTTAVPGSGRVFTQMWPVVTGSSTQVADMLEYEFFTPPAPPAPIVTKIAITNSKRVIKVVVTNPKHKVVTITIGSYVFTNTPATGATSASYSITVPKGKTKVKVTCNGKTLTKTFTVK